MPVGEERGDGGDDAAQHDPDQWHEQGVAGGQTVDDAEEDPRADQREDSSDAHFRDDGCSGQGNCHDQNAECGGFDGPDHGGFHKPVAGHLLHDEPCDCESGAREDDGQGAWYAGDPQDFPRALVACSQAGRLTSETPTNMETTASRRTVASAPLRSR